jgi:prevent-host-death family protein
MYIKLLRLGRVKPRRQTTLAQYNIYDARTYLSRLVDRVIDGEEIVIARANRPVAKLVPYEGFELTQPAVLRAKILVEEVPPPWAFADARAASTNGSTPDPADRRG